MRIPRQLVAGTLFLLLSVMSGDSTMRVVQKEVSVARALSGRVLIRGTGEAANRVIVELCSSDWKTVLSSTKTDEKGRFALEKKATAKLFYIRVSAPGMDIYELRVRVNKHATNDLTIYVSVAT